MSILLTFFTFMTKNPHLTMIEDGGDTIFDVNAYEKSNSKLSLNGPLKLGPYQFVVGGIVRARYSMTGEMVRALKDSNKNDLPLAKISQSYVEEF